MIKTKNSSSNLQASSVSSPEEVAQMSGIQKFLFDYSFDTETTVSDNETVELIDEEEQEEIIPTFSEEEVESARNEAFKKGKEQGINETTAAREQSLVEAIEKLKEQVEDLNKLHEQVAESTLNDTIEIATTINRKLFPALNEQGALKEIENFVVEALRKNQEEPKIDIRIHPDLEPLINEHISSLLNKVNYRGEIEIFATEDVPIGDCHIEWKCGGAQRDTDSLWNEIDKIIERNVLKSPNIKDKANEDIVAKINIDEDNDPNIEPDPLGQGGKNG